MSYFTVKLLGAATAALLLANAAQATTYYIDYAAGNDANTGTAKTAPWRRHPYMTGWSGRYTHAAGDQFIFKGGVTWPRAAFQMHITAGGNSSARDYYGVDKTWFSGASWLRPVFDFEDTLIGTGWNSSAGIWVDTVSYITFDNLEMKRHRGPITPSGADWGACTINLYGSAAYITISNCYIHDWSIPTPGAGQDGGGTGGICQVYGAGAGIRVLNSTFTQANAAVRNGVAVHTWCELANCEIYQVCNAFLGSGNIHDNHVHDVVGATDPYAHENAIYCMAPSTVYNNRVHNLDVNSSAIYLSPSFSGGTGYDLVYNNVVYGCGNQAPIQVDLEGAYPSQTGSRIYNNTLEHGNAYCIRTVLRGTAVLGLLDCRNNHLITSATAIGYNNPTAGCANVNSVTMVANLTQTPTQASASGYTSSNDYSPNSGSAPTINVGTDLSSIFTTDIRGSSRPAGAWDIGAYEYTGTISAPNAPPVISAIQTTTPDASSTDAGLQIAEGTSVALTATVTDPEGQPVTWTWSYSLNGGASTAYSYGSGTQASATFTYPAGTGGNSYTWTLQGSDGASTASAQFVVVVMKPAPSGTSITLEAESGVVLAPFGVSNGYISQSIQTTLSNGGRATYTFSVTQSGDYKVGGLVNAPSDASNSLYVNIDAEPLDPYSVWHIPVTNGFESRTVSWQGNGTWDNSEITPKYFTLSAGQHTLIIVGREAGVQLDRLCIVRIPAPPQNLRMASGQ